MKRFCIIFGMIAGSLALLAASYILLAPKAYAGPSGAALFQGQTTTPTPSATCAPGGPIIVNGAIIRADPTQTAGLFRDGVPDTCTAPGFCGSNAREGNHYDAYTYTNSTGSQACVSVNANTACTGTNLIYVAAYLGSFDPTNICQNFAASIGSSPNPTGNFSFLVPAGGSYVIVASEVTVNAGCPAYTLTITGGGGSSCTTVTPTPAVSATATVVATATRTSTIAPTIPPTATRTSTIAPTTILPTATATVCPIQFSDVPSNHTFYANIRCLACRGIISGYADGTFRPNNLVTRGQLAKIVSNAAGYTESPDPQIFEDVPSANTFYQWINRLARRGHMSGYPCGGVGEPCITGMPYFRPFANATRGQTSKIVSNAAGYSEIPTGQTFEDVPPTHTFDREIQRLASRNIMGGYPCGGVGEPCVSGRPYFRPGNDVTRGQSAKIVANTFYPGCDTP